MNTEQYTLTNNAILIHYETLPGDTPNVVMRVHCHPSKFQEALALADNLLTFTKEQANEQD
jgi:hypothetical protein